LGELVMSFERPDLATLIERIQNDAQSRLSVAQLRRSNANVFAKVLAGAVHTLYGFIAYLHRQQFFDTAEAEYLDRWGSLYGLTRKKASKATGSVVFSFSDGQVSIPEGTVLQHEDGAQYVTTSGVDSDNVVTVEALTAGTDGNQTAGDVLSLVSPISGVYSESTIKALSGGSEEESDSAFRSRLLERVQETPHAGTQSDYENWALEVPGVTRAWCNPLEDGNGSVAVRFVCDENESILPDKAMLDLVQSYLDDLRPVTAQVYVKQITRAAASMSRTSVLLSVPRWAKKTMRLNRRFLILYRTAMPCLLSEKSHGCSKRCGIHGPFEEPASARTRMAARRHNKSLRDADRSLGGGAREGGLQSVSFDYRSGPAFLRRKFSGVAHPVGASGRVHKTLVRREQHDAAQAASLEDQGCRHADTKLLCRTG
jgi:uncharacterized phage protein gp47/JayE